MKAKPKLLIRFPWTDILELQCFCWKMHFAGHRRLGGASVYRTNPFSDENTVRAWLFCYWSRATDL
jgi:hypothetical protein